MEVKIDKTSIMITGDVKVSFKTKIKKHLLIHNKIIILLDSLLENGNENVFCLNADGGILWRIKSLKYPNSFCPVMNIYEENEKLFVYRSCGIEEEVMMSNGEIVNSELIK